MDTVKQILAYKGSVVHCIHPDATVTAALRQMSRHNIGALVVKTGPLPLGMFTERDYARKSFSGEFSAQTTTVQQLMQVRVPWITPDHSVRHCMELMTRRRVRHLPVIDHYRLTGLVSIGDVVHSMIAEREFEIVQLQAYISGIR